MKAKEYYTSVKKAIEIGTATALKNAADNMFLGMNREVQDGIFPVIKEMNDKWNAVVDLIEKDYGWSPIIRDAYKKFWIANIPELESHI